MKPLATLLLLPALHALAQAGPQPCRKDGVEWLLGGAAVACISGPTLAPTRPPDAGAGAARQRISATEQHGRDDERAYILRQELREAEARLERLQTGADAEARQRLRADIEALQKEISRLPTALRSVR